MEYEDVRPSRWLVLLTQLEKGSRLPGLRRLRQHQELRQVLRGEKDQLHLLRRQLQPHVLLMTAGMLDLLGKLQSIDDVRDPKRGYPGLPLDLDPSEAANGLQAEAVRVIAGFSEVSLDARLNYSLACLWARDARMRATNRDDAIGRSAAHLRLAVSNESAFLRRWQSDPDLVPLADQLRRLQVPVPPVPAPDRVGNKLDHSAPGAAT